MTIFTFVKSQLINSLREESTTGSLEFNKGLPTNVIQWLCKEGVFKVDKVEKEKNTDGKYVYTVFYKDLNNYSPFLKDDYERLEKKGVVGEAKNKPITVKFGYIYDKYRQELECPNWEKSEDRGFEYLEPEDNVCLELVLGKLNYENYEDFCNKHPELSIDQIRETLQEELKEFEENKAKEYAF